MQLVPTKTFVLDIGRHCNINCKFCYYHQLGDLRKQGWKSWNYLIEEIIKGKERGNNRVEITGGEPTLFPQIAELIKKMKTMGLEVCVITNGIIAEKKLEDIIEAGTDEFLISFHGTEKTHDELTIPGARKIQIKTLRTLRKYENDLLRGFRFNFVINAWNQHEIMKTAEEMSIWLPTIVNFINMNPHHGWQNDPETKNVIADLRIVETQLNEAIKYLELITIDCNVRYYPMCCIAEEYRKCICNDLHVMFDPKEWDYSIIPKTYEVYKQWGINTSNNVEEKGKPCCHCHLQWICGGANKHFHKASNEMFGELLIPQYIHDLISKNNFYYYRKNNFEKSTYF